MIRITKRVEGFEITIETDEPFSKEALETLLYETYRKQRLYKTEQHQCPLPPPEPSGLEK